MAKKHQNKNPSRFILPAVLPAIVDREVNIYFENITLAPYRQRYIFGVSCSKGRQQEERWTWVPGAADVGDLRLELEIRSLDDEIIARGSTIVQVVPANAGEGRTVTHLPIGDSLLQGPLTYSDELLRLFSAPGNPDYRLLGTHKVAGAIAGNIHEGYGGWKYIDFVQRYIPNPEPESRPKDRTSPFVFETQEGPQFDFPRYINERLGGVRPDFVSILLGANDMFFAVDENREEMATRALDAAEVLLTGIREGAPNASIGIMTSLPPCSNQDGFAQDYGCLNTRWNVRKSLHRFVEKTYERFGRREHEGVHVIASYLNFDSEHNYPIEPSVPIHARTEQRMNRTHGALHPVSDGYRQIADSLYAWLKWMLAKDGHPCFGQENSTS